MFALGCGKRGRMQPRHGDEGYQETRHPSTGSGHNVNEVKHRHACHESLAVESSRWQSPVDQPEIAADGAARNDVSNVLSGSTCHGCTRKHGEPRWRL